MHVGAYKIALVVKNPPANTGDPKDRGLSVESGRSPVVGSDNYPSIIS